MAAEASRSNSTADSYVGSLISLTSKSEIRYEGILYNINTDESSIGLRNVRSFGTEGRKKDGPQVLGSDKVYEYILFRGSDIKDLQVKSSPPVQSSSQTAPPINSDPAIIQSHYPQPSSTSSSIPAAGAGSLTDLDSNNAQTGQQPGLSYHGGMPSYQTGGNLGPWGPSPPIPSANGSGLPMPMYWPGYYAPPNGLPQLQQQSLLRPPPGLSMPSSMQQPMQFPSFNASLPSGASNLPVPKLAEYPLPLGMLPTTTGSLNLTSSSFPLNLPPVPPLGLSSEPVPSFMQNKVPSPAISMTSLNASLPSLSPLTCSSPDVNVITPSSISNKPVPNPSLPYQAFSQTISSIIGVSNSSQTEKPSPSLVTPGQLLKSAVSSSQSSNIAHKDVEMVHVSPRKSSELPAVVAAEAQPPILPLPPASRPVQKPNGASYQARLNDYGGSNYRGHTNYRAHNNYRGRERGRGLGTSRPVMKFNEEFDFTAMNEKFNKDEVWGHLWKSKKFNFKEKEGDGTASEEDNYEDEDETNLPKFEVKPVYTKDDFFDTLSSNAVDNQSNNGRTRFSEQMKLDTETFGEFSRYNSGRGGRGPARGGRSRGGYYGRGYDYTGRGRGRSMPSRDY